jgi:hypothetical protein
MNGKSRVLLILPEEIVDRARVFAGRAMIALKLPDRPPAGRRLPRRREQPTARTWERGRSDAVVKWVAAIAWATVAAVALGGAQPAPAPATPAAPVSASVATGEATKENVTAEGETSHATEEASLKAAAFYLYLLIRSH